jgi:hypothetical protein
MGGSVGRPFAGALSARPVNLSTVGERMGRCQTGRAGMEFDQDAGARSLVLSFSRLASIRLMLRHASKA